VRRQENERNRKKVHRRKTDYSGWSFSSRALLNREQDAQKGKKEADLGAVNGTSTLPLVKIVPKKKSQNKRCTRTPKRKKHGKRKSVKHAKLTLLKESDVQWQMGKLEEREREGPKGEADQQKRRLQEDRSHLKETASHGVKRPKFRFEGKGRSSHRRYEPLVICILVPRAWRSSAAGKSRSGV